MKIIIWVFIWFLDITNHSLTIETKYSKENFKLWNWTNIVLVLYLKMLIVIYELSYFKDNSGIIFNL